MTINHHTMTGGIIKVNYQPEDVPVWVQLACPSCKYPCKEIDVKLEFTYPAMQI